MGDGLLGAEEMSSTLRIFFCNWFIFYKNCNFVGRKKVFLKILFPIKRTVVHNFPTLPMFFHRKHFSNRLVLNCAINMLYDYLYNIIVLWERKCIIIIIIITFSIKAVILTDLDFATWQTSFCCIQKSICHIRNCH